MPNRKRQKKQKREDRRVFGDAYHNQLLHRRVVKRRRIPEPRTKGSDGWKRWKACLRKVAFPTLEEAEREAARLTRKKKGRQSVHAYECPHPRGGQYHFHVGRTSTPRRRRVRTEEEIRESTTYHPPSETGKERHQHLSQEFYNLMMEIERVCPDGRAKAVVFTKLEEAKMWASKSIAMDPATR